MKLTDFALIFIAIMLPVIIVVYVNVSFTIKAFQQEMYYRKMVDVAVQDAMLAMKEVEGDDPEYDYGYSGVVDNKVNINANVAKDTFFESMYSNLGLRLMPGVVRYVQQFIPAIAIIDYNGVYISSIDKYNKETDSNQFTEVTEHIVKPKRYYSYSYGINNAGEIVDNPDLLANKNNFNSIHHVEFTLDDRITHYGENKHMGFWEDFELKSFFIKDSVMNKDIYNNKSDAILQNKVINHLLEKRKEIVVKTITNEMIYAVNKNNVSAREVGITYNFVFPDIPVDDMYRYIQNTGMLVMVQGIRVGNKHLNYSAFGGGDLALRRRFVFSIFDDGKSKFNTNLYHKGKECPEYRVSDNENLIPESVDTKSKASSAIIRRRENGNIVEHTGFYPCSVCRP